MNKSFNQHMNRTKKHTKIVKFCCDSEIPFQYLFSNLAISNRRKLRILFIAYFACTILTDYAVKKIQHKHILAKICGILLGFVSRTVLLSSKVNLKYALMLSRKVWLMQNKLMTEWLNSSSQTMNKHIHISNERHFEIIPRWRSTINTEK